MKIFVFLFLISPLAIAANSYQIDTQVLIDGKLVSNSNNLVLDGPKGIQDEKGPLKMKLVATEVKSGESKGAVQLAYDLHYSSEKQVIKAKPTLIIRLGESAAMSIGPEGKEELTVRVKAVLANDPAKIVDAFEETEKEFASMPMSDQDYLEVLEMTEPAEEKEVR